MPTEAFQLRDGSQCAAAANYNNPAVALAGPLGSGQFLLVYISAERKVSIASSPITQASYGILQNTPNQNDPADVCIAGVTKAVAGAPTAAGLPLMVDASGRLIAWVAGAKNRQVGISIDAAANTNSVFSVRLFPTPLSSLT